MLLAGSGIPPALSPSFSCDKPLKETDVDARTLTTAPEMQAITQGGGELGRLIRAYDWAATPLGPIESWPQCLKTTVNTLLLSPVPIVLLWGDDGIMLYNDAYSGFAGGNHPRLLGSKVREGWAEVADFNDHVMRVGLAGGTLSYKSQELTLHRHGKPEQVWMNLDYSPILDESGTPVGVIAFVIETTEQILAARQRDAAERALRVERDRSQGVLNNMGEAFLLLDQDLRILDLNTEALKMESRSLEQLVGMKHGEAYPAASPRIEVLYRQALTERRPVAHEHQYTWPDGRVSWIDMRAYPVSDGLAVFYRDVTHRHDNQERLRRSEAFLGATLDALPIGVIIADAKGHILRTNAANKKLWGIAPKALDWTQYDQWVGYRPESGERIRAEEWAMARALLCGETVQDELVECERFDGTGRRQFLNNAAPIYDSDGTLLGGVAAEVDITERAEISRRLRESEALARDNIERVQLALSAGAIIGTWVWDLTCDRFTVDEAFAHSFGIDPALGRKGLSLEQVIATVHPEDKPGLIEAVNTSIARGGNYAHQYRVRRRDGQYYWIEANGRVDYASDGTPHRFPGVLIDVESQRALEKERDQASALLHEKALEFETLANNIPTLCWMAHPDGEIYWFNQRWYEYTGTSFASMQGWGWKTVHDPSVLPLVVEGWTHSLKTGQPFDMTFPLRGHDGIFRPFLTRVVPIYNALGQIERWFGTNTDITSQQKAEDALRELNTTLALRIEQRTQERDRMWRLSTDVMLVARFDATIVAVNPAWTAILGWSEQELLGGSLTDYVHPDDIESTAAAMAELAMGMPVHCFQNRYRHRDGSYRWLSWTAVPDEQFLHAVGRDIQSERESQEALQRTEEQLRQSQKMEAVGQLTGGLAHDFNNLLTGIAGSLELLNARVQQGRLTELDRYIHIAQSATKRAAALTHRLLAFSRRQTLDPKPTDLNRLVAGMDELIRRTTGPHISLETVAAGGLWPTLVDASQLESALLNLCINARDAMPEGGRITIETANKWIDEYTSIHYDMTAGQYVALSITDTGTGMSPEVIAKAFDPFFTTKPTGEGTGLGLSMVYGFVRQSGGQVRIYSELGMGTTMCLYLPRYHGHPKETDPTVEPVEALQAHTGETILVVDDEPAIRMLIIEVLNDHGYLALEAADGEAALQVLQSSRRIDLLVTDVGLPEGMNGRQLADAARAIRPDLKVLFITGYAENAVIGNGHVEAGMEIMTKPFAIEKLVSRIKKLIS